MFVLVSQGYELLLDGIHWSLLEFSNVSPVWQEFLEWVGILTKLIRTYIAEFGCETKLALVGIGALMTRSPLGGVMTSLRGGVEGRLRLCLHSVRLPYEGGQLWSRWVNWEGEVFRVQIPLYISAEFEKFEEAGRKAPCWEKSDAWQLCWTEGEFWLLPNPVAEMNSFPSRGEGLRWSWRDVGFLVEWVHECIRCLRDRLNIPREIGQGGESRIWCSLYLVGRVLRDRGGGKRDGLMRLKWVENGQVEIYIY